MRRSWRNALPLAVFVALALLLMPKALAGRATYVAVDLVEQTAPYRDAIGRPPHVVSPIQTDQTEGTAETVHFWDELKHGRWLTWEPHVAGGMPLGTLPIFGLLSPLNLGLLVLPAWYAVTLRAFAALLVCQGFTYLFLRRLDIGRAAATVGAVAYAFNGTNMVFVQRLEAVFVFPLLLWCVERAIERASIGRLLALGGATTWLWFAGFPSGFFYCVYFAGAWAAWRLWRIARRRVRAGDLPRDVAREALGRAAALAGGVAWGVAVAAVNLFPFLASVSSQNLLAQRHYTSSSHLPPIQLFGLIDLGVTGPPLKVPLWSGVNSVESVSFVGSIVVLAAACALIVALTRRLRLAPAAGDAFAFFGVAAALVTTVVFRGTVVLDALYAIPGIANNPINRTRFLIAFGLVVVASVALDAWWRRGAGASKRHSASVVAAALTLAVLAALAVPQLRDVVRQARAAKQLSGIERGALWGVAAAAAAVGLAVLGRRAGAARAIAVAGLCGLLFWQLAWPLRNFTPQAPVADFYRREPAQGVLEQLTGGDYRFAATAFNFYPNSSALFGVDDLRGVSLYSDQFRNLLNTASPKTFTRDRLKQVLTRDEYHLASPVYDDVALRYFALGTDEMPYGTVVPVDTTWNGWIDADGRRVTRDFTMPQPSLQGIEVPVRAAADCARSELAVEVRSGSKLLDVTSRPARDAAAGWLALAVTGGSLPAGAPVSLSVRATPSCHLEVGAMPDDPAHAAVQTIVDDPTDGVVIAATEQAWIYERPTARPIVSTHGSWLSFADQSRLLDWLRTRTGTDVAAIQLQAPGGRDLAAPEPVNGVDGSLHDIKLGTSRVSLRTSAASQQLVTVAENAAPGWHVTVDGKHAHVESVDGALLGVIVPAGTHTVEFDYRPSPFAIGRLISVLALLAGFGALAFSRLRRGRTGDQAGAPSRPAGTS